MKRKPPAKVTANSLMSSKSVERAAMAGATLFTFRPKRQGLKSRQGVLSIRMENT